MTFPHFIPLLAGLVISVAIVGAQEASPGVSPGNVPSPSNRTPLKVADFGALGDGIHDDGPAISAAFKAARDDDGPSVVAFEKKIYRLGDNPGAWHYFQLSGHEDLVIEGDGATLLCPESILAFHFEGGRNITVRGLAFDTPQPSFTQGEVVAMDDRGTLDVKIMDGYPDPPVEAFLKGNGYEAFGGGGRHMIVFEKGGSRRNTRMGNDHLYIRTITNVSPGVFRFQVKEDYLPAMKGLVAGNWISYGFNKVNLPKSVVAAKDKSPSTYAQIAADRVENLTLEKLDFLGSLNGGIRVSDMPGDVTLRGVRIVRKPGSRNLLSTPSDALHLMNIRGKLLIEDCEIEAPGDDCLNVGTLLERIVAVSKEDPRALTLCTTDNRYYHYTIRQGDRLQFLDTKAKREIFTATVDKVEFDLPHRTHRVVVDKQLPAFDPASVLVLNLNQLTSSTVIRHNVMKPFMRNAMLVRAQHMTVEGNQLDGSPGGVMGLNLTTSMEESASLRDIRVLGNTITSFQSAGLLMSNRYRDPEGIFDARDFQISGNTFRDAAARVIRIRGVQNLSLEGNRFEKDGKPVERIEDCLEVVDCPGPEAIPR